MTIFHIAHVSTWDAATARGYYDQSTRDATLAEVGYLHASGADQLASVAEAFYADDPQPLCVLEISRAAIEQAGTRVIDEDGGNGQLYPHIYGRLDPAWVTRVHPATFVDGRFSWGE